MSIDFIVNFINRYLEFSEETMGRKKIKKNKGKPFVSGDPRSNFGSPSCYNRKMALNWKKMADCQVKTLLIGTTKL